MGIVTEISQGSVDCLYKIIIDSSVKCWLSFELDSLHVIEKSSYL